MLLKSSSTLIFFLFSHAEAGVEAVRQLDGFTVPKHIQKLIDFVSGLTELPYLKPRKVFHNQQYLHSFGFVVPPLIRKLYNVPDTLYSTKRLNSQAVIEFSPVGSPFFTDMQNYASQISMPFTNITKIIGPWQPGSEDTESVLDVELLTNVAPRCATQYWTFANGWAYEMALAIFNTPSAAFANSVSYGWPETLTCQSSITHADCTGINAQQYVARGNTEFQKTGSLGLSFMIATQDEGAPSEANEFCSLDGSNPVWAIYPSSSPYVTAVSSTTVMPANTMELKALPPICQNPQYPCTTGHVELPSEVNNTYFQWTTGGGFSAYGKRPSYQTAAVSRYLQTSQVVPPSQFFPPDSRGYADVSSVGARILVINYGSISPSAGTSASTPIFAGIATLLNDRRLNAGKKQLGFLNPLLYQMGAKFPSAFQDIASGDNRCTLGGTCCRYGYGAIPGWDPTSGWGTPNFGEMAKYIDSLP